MKKQSEAALYTPSEYADEVAKDDIGSVNTDKERVEVLDKLGQKITDLFMERARMRVSKELEWANAQRLYNSPLTGSSADLPETPFASENDTKKRRPEPNIVRHKCDTAIANCVSLQFAAGEKNWDMFPPPNSRDAATTESCRLMEKEVEAQLAATKYAMQSRRAIEERVILGSGVLKGPVNTGKMRIEYYPDPATGDWLPRVSSVHTPKTCHVPLWRFYPDMSVTDVYEMTDALEIHPMTALELSQYIKHPGFDGKAIELLLKGDTYHDPVKPSRYNDSLVTITADIWKRNPYLYKDRFVVIEYHGPVTYDDLNKLGIVPTYESPTQEYYGEVWVCAGKVIRMELENIEGYYETPYSMAVWKRDPTSIFGFGHPLLLADAQRVVTQAYHMILDNASLTSAPQVAMYQKYIQPVDGDWTLSPGKVWLLTDPTTSIDKAIEFFNPTNVIGNIMPVLQLARQFADEESATLAFGGLQSPQSQDSATGNMLLQHASNVLLDFAAEEWDDQVTEKIVRRYYAWNMQYNPKQEIKGDYVIDVKSSSEYKNKQMYIRDLERLQMETSQNPTMAMAINTDELVKARLAMMHLPSNRIVRSAEEIVQAQQQQANQPDPAMIDLQIRQQELAIRGRELQLKEAQLQFEMAQQQQRELWEHEEKMGSNEARLAEANASVLKARSEVEVEMIQLAQKDEQFKGKLAADAQMKELDTRAKVFLKGIEESRKNRENDLYQQEMELKHETGSGI